VVYYLLLINGGVVISFQVYSGLVIKETIVYDKDWAVLFYWSIHYSNVLPPNSLCAVFLHHWFNRKTT